MSAQKSTMSTVPLRRFVDDDQWEAEDLAGRLGIVAHTAFLRAGFVPHGDAPRSGNLLLRQVDETAPPLSRRYTAPHLAHREGADVAVLKLRMRGNGDVAFQAYLLTRDRVRPCLCQALLAKAALAPLLSCRLADAARALETGTAGAWLWKSLADWVFRVLLLELCLRNDLPVTSLTSLPDDAKMEILKRVTNGKDLARVECASRQLRRLVAERDGELWKAMYESLVVLPETRGSEGVSSWKEMYVKGWQQLQQQDHSAPPRFRLFLSDEEEEWVLNLVESLVERRRQRDAGLRRLWKWKYLSAMEDDPFTVARRVIEHAYVSYLPYSVPDPPAPDPLADPAPEMVARGKNVSRKRPKVPTNDYQKKPHGTGAIHSPSSRYRWKHR